MGTLIGHLAPGFGFFLIGLWHLFSHTKLFARNSRKYRSHPWFPSAQLRHLELYLIMIGSSVFFLVEFFISPDRHTLFDPDGTIGSNHLHNFEHASIALMFLVYAAFALAFDRLFRVPSLTHDNILALLVAMSFAQQFLLFHLHSADHMGVEGQYHWLLQLVVAVSLATTLLGIAWPASFVVGYVRSLSVLFQGVWLMLTGFMLWTPGLIPKGCFMNREEGHWVVRCSGEKSLHRARSLVNIEFSWLLIGLAVFAASFYVLMIWVYANEVEYLSVEQQEEDEDEEDVEAQRISKFVGEMRRLNFKNVEHALPNVD